MPERKAWLTIGQIGRRSGLTPKALRHYDRIGLLRPAVVDPATGYRMYAESQVALAHVIHALRELEVPLSDVQDVLDAHPDPNIIDEVLLRHRRRLDARFTRSQGLLHSLNHAIDDRRDLTMENVPPAVVDDADVHKRLGPELFNRTWELLEKEDRSSDEDAEMIHTAHASAFHWRKVGTPTNFARSEWQCSRVYAVLDHAEEAKYFAARSLALCEENGIGDFDLAFAYEAHARAAGIAGDRVEALKWAELARRAGEVIADDGDRSYFNSDLATLPIS
jgi:DNA-binding transcriptional MerR regulator